MGGSRTSDRPVRVVGVSGAANECVVVVVDLEGRCGGWVRLFGLLAQEGDQIIPILALLQTTESHLRAGDVLLGVLEVFVQSVLLPVDALLLVGVGV